MREIDEVVSLIRNGRWHNLEDITARSKLSESKTNKILEFLANYNFITFDNENKKAKVTSSLLRFLKENQTC